MSRFAVFLRGMNVGGHRLTNADLRAQFVAMGFSDVATFRASGNVIVSGAEPDASRIERDLAAALGYEVPTFIRAADEVVAMAAKQPFALERVRASAGKLQVALLTAPAPPRVREAVLALAEDSDGLAFDPRELYWLPSGPMLDSTLDLKAVERLLGAMTLRTKGTIEQIAGRHFAAAPTESPSRAR